MANVREIPTYGGSIDILSPSYQAPFLRVIESSLLPNSVPLNAQFVDDMRYLYAHTSRNIPVLEERYVSPLHWLGKRKYRGREAGNAVLFDLNTREMRVFDNNPIAGKSRRTAFGLAYGVDPAEKVLEAQVAGHFDPTRRFVADIHTHPVLSKEALDRRKRATRKSAPISASAHEAKIRDFFRTIDNKIGPLSLYDIYTSVVEGRRGFIASGSKIYYLVPLNYGVLDYDTFLSTEYAAAREKINTVIAQLGESTTTPSEREAEQMILEPTLDVCKRNNVAVFAADWDPNALPQDIELQRIV